MRILVVEPGKYPYEKEIEGSLKSMQNIVDGRIQAVYPFEDEIAVVCNDEGVLLGMPFNREICEDLPIVGTFFVCGLGKESFDSLSDNFMDKYKKLFKYPQIFTTKGIIEITPESYKKIMEQH